MGYLVKYLFNVHPSVTEAFRKLDNSTHTQWAMVWEAAPNEVPTEETKRDNTTNTLAVFAGGSHALQLANPPLAKEIGTPHPPPPSLVVSDFIFF